MSSHRITTACRKVISGCRENDAFVVTCYLTDKAKEGEELWPTR
jgi:hypothetical protein